MKATRQMISGLKDKSLIKLAETANDKFLSYGSEKENGYKEAERDINMIWAELKKRGYEVEMTGGCSCCDTGLSIYKKEEQVA